MSKPYTYQKGKFVVPLEDIDPLQYLESKATASIPLKDITPEVALQVLKHNPKELKKAPWSVRHNILTALLGGGVGMGAGAGIGRLFKRHRPFSTAVGGLLGLTLGAETGNIYSDIKSLKKVEQLAKQKKLKTASFQAAFFDELEKIKEAGIMGKATFVMGGPAVWAAGKLGGKAFKTAVRYSPQGLMARTARGVAGKKKGILPSLGRGAGKVMDFSSNLGQPLY